MAHVMFLPHKPLHYGCGRQTYTMIVEMEVLLGVDGSHVAALIPLPSLVSGILSMKASFSASTKY
jgi:hypothetical protein